MSDVNYSEVLFQSIDQIVEERLKQIQYDRTILCKVIEAYPDDNKYWVNCEGLKLQVQSIDPKKTYSKDSMVYVLMPEGNYENVKVIIGGYNDKDIEKKVFNNSYDDFISNQTFKFDSPMTFKLEDINTSKEIASDNYIPIQYDQEYDYVGVEWAMTTYSLFDAGINSGKYTLEVLFGYKKEDDSFDAIISYPIESSSIYGNPYNLSEEFKQYNLFPYSEKLNNCNSFKIILYQGVQKDNNPEKIIDKFSDKAQELSITLNYLHLSVGYSKAKFAENQTLNLKKGDSLNYKTNDFNLQRTLYLDWRVIDKEANKQIFNYNYLEYLALIENANIYWLKYQENIGYKSTQIIKDYTNIDGLYNWEIISTNSFEYNPNIDTDYQMDQYKVFIVYDSKNAETEDDSDKLTNYKFTNTIIFENLDIAAIQPGSSNSDNNSNDLKFTLNEGNTGVYNVYGLDGRMSDSSKGGPYTITASLFDSLQDKISNVEWIFPQSNTMIIDDRSANRDSLSTNEKLKVQYRIKNRYYPSATQNTIRCKVTMSTGEIRNGSISFEFGQLGNQGTNYAFNIDFIGKNYLTNGENEEIQVKATLSNQNGEEVLLEDFINNLEWSWLFTTDGKVIDKDSTTEITSLSNIVCSKYQNNIVKLYLNNSFEMSEYNYSILQAKLKEYNTGDGIKADLTSYLCIPVAAADTDQIKPRSIQGATTIVYDSLGTSTSHSTEYYEVINDTNNYIDELEWNLSSQIAGYTGFPDLGKYQKKEEDSDKTITKYKIKPSSYVPLKTPPVSIIAKKNDSVIWNQPILIIQNTWFNETINEWNGVLKINEKDGSILSPLLIAGTKGSNNLFTGVTVGQLDTGSTTTNRIVNGVYGFKDGEARFWLNQDAEFYVGTGKDKNLYFDNNGNFTIAANKFKLTAQYLTLSSDNNGQFKVGNNNYYLNFSNSRLDIKAKNFILDTNTLKIDTQATNNDPVLTITQRARIGGWSIDTDSLYGEWKTKTGSYTNYVKIKVPDNGTDTTFLDVKYNGTFPFVVTKTGHLTATDATISGKFEKIDLDGNSVQVGNSSSQGDLIFGNTYTSGEGCSVIKCKRSADNHQLTFGVQRLKYDDGSYSQETSAAITYLHPYNQKFGTLWISSGYINTGNNKDNGSSLVLQAGRLYATFSHPMNYFARITLNGNDHDYESSIQFQAKYISHCGTTIHENSQSDSRLKYDIEVYDERYNIFFDNLKPVRYKYYHGTSNRYHTGFIAQDMAIELEHAGLTTQDLAAIFKVQLPQYKDTLGETWQLRRDELVSLNTWQIQKLKTRVTELENEIKEIKQRYEI